ncbi:fasciclin-like arabinogalactan protein 14 [Rhododendron vialii]|uniref:fasciclin-like arabinogalactan protein 14 n=1 Tax=Rhododendron vialii TaxID=182163 RepID=UPI00265F9275|nr:fasciclin-like arabinogalactan protein 14 [Rhododendron vialii]
MGAQSCIVAAVFAVLFSTLCVSPAEAGAAATAQKPKFDILEVLAGSKQGSFSTFISLLNQTGLAKEINSRDTITVLAVGDGAIGGLASKNLDRIKDILSTHVILDYYGIDKIQDLSSKKNTTVTTMYQATGVADGMQGYLKIVVLPNQGPQLTDRIRIGSAAKGAPFDIRLLSDTEVAFKKFDYVVLSISGVIFTPGIDGLTPPPTAAPAPAPKKTPVAPAPHHNTTTATPAPSPVDDDADYDTPTPEAAPAPAPVLSSPSESVDAPTADDTPATTTPPPSSSAIHISSTYIFTALIVVLVSSFASAGL